MKNLFVKISLFSLLCSGPIACTEDFDQTNINPNLVSEVTPGSLINPVLYNLASNNAIKNYDITSALMQVHVPFPDVTAGGVHRYDITDRTGNSSWNAAYRWLTNINEMLVRSKELKQSNYEAISLTLRAYAFANLTDIFGDVPFSEAFRAEEGISQAKFDSQKEIYQTLLADLERANSLYDHKIPLPYVADLLFGNDITKWQKFTNSLHLRLLLRVSDKSEMNAFPKMVNMLSNPEKYPIMTSNLDNAVLQVTGISPNVSPWARPQDFNNGRAMAEFFIDQLVESKDPRILKIATQAKSLGDNNSIGYKGIPAGYDGSEAFDFSPSGLLRIQAEAPMKITLFTYSEIEFIQAELAYKGYASDAEKHYQNGVKAAIEYLTEEEIPIDYFDSDATRYDGTLERIMLQKYLSLYFVDYQQWFEYRRTGYPNLPKIPAGKNDGVVPSRLLYPSSVKIYNKENYDKAVAAMGGDNINTKVWWQTK